MKTKSKILFCTVSLLVCFSLTHPVSAQTLNLTISRHSINFLDSDPDTVPSVPASQNPVTITVRVRQNGGGAWRLTVLASGDLVSGSNTIAISNVSWTAQPAPFVAGVMSRTTPQVVASGRGNVNPAINGTIRFYFNNSWNYFTGNYSQVIIYTLTAP